jgi:pyrroline-5-carboxylate reductase
VIRTPSNKAIVERSDVVFLAVRPAQVETALNGIDFRSDQMVVSFVTGLSLKELEALAPRSAVCRVLPLPLIEYGKGPIVCHPAHPAMIELFSPLGDLVCVDSEEELLAFGRTSAFMSTFFELQHSLIRWLESQGMARPQASLYVRSMLAGLADTALRSSVDDHANLASHHETKGGLNERVRRHLLELGWFEQPIQAFDLLQRLQRTDLD